MTRSNVVICLEDLHESKEDLGVCRDEENLLQSLCQKCLGIKIALTVQEKALACRYEEYNSLRGCVPTVVAIALYKRKS